MRWDLIKAPLIVPLLQFAVYVCLAMTVMLFVERLYMGIVVILVKLFWKKPGKRYNWEPIRDDLAIENSAFLLVLIQIPMFNEKEVHNLGMVVIVGNGGDAIVAGLQVKVGGHCCKLAGGDELKKMIVGRVRVG
ncbi:putative glucomannan 4-beta-mannosyltransferase [Helianthus annuus]|uniref:Glucomannan 4-beta-mannosyltransferase n=1 Tax=Helianthus annuus TaxID=4232 RepID=A0A9K3JI08_HELAN|nr:putative glucomannan 4-beta-mannosyltransferase [Helianthus annuus]KAJ0944123.1 putative glucomannan 4-beta-mannosyltransferase [Helianthus annuus]